MLCLAVSLQAAADLITVHAWHHDVEQDQIRHRLLHGQLQPLRPAGGNLDFVLRRHGLAEQHQVVNNVVDNQKGVFLFAHYVHSAHGGLDSTTGHDDKNVSAVSV